MGRSFSPRAYFPEEQWLNNLKISFNYRLVQVGKQKKIKGSEMLGEQTLGVRTLREE